MSILVFGGSGQLATELARHAGVTCLGRDRVDLMTPGTAEAAIKTHSPKAVINAAAYTAVDKAETEPDQAHRLNAEAPGEMAAACATAGIPFVHVSTDYVFPGTGTTPWSPADTPDPINAYGRTKLAGEEAVRAAGGPHVILRTSWVVSAHGANFLKTMLRLGAERDALSIVADQIGGPTGAKDIASACLTIAKALEIDPNKAGTYHFAGAPSVSWADFARAIFNSAGLTCTVTDIPSSDYPTPAARPLNSRLDCAETETVFGIPQPKWQATIDDILKELSHVQA